MVGRFTLPSLPSLPAALADLLDTSPQVFYPASRPTSRQSFSGQPPTSSCPGSPRRKALSFDDGDGGLPPLPPPPYWSAAAHPHTDAPLGHCRSQSTYSLSSYGAPSQAFPAPLAQLPPRGSSLQSEPEWRPSGAPSRRPSHKRSQSAAPGSFHAPTLARLESRSTTSVSRQLVSNTSASSLPTLAEDSGPSPSLLERSQSDRERRQSHLWLEPAPPPPRPRRRAQSSVTLLTAPRAPGTFVEPALPDRLRRNRHSFITSSTTTVALTTSTPPSTMPTAPSTPRSIRSRRGSVSSFTEAGRASPSVVSVSDIAAQATWSQEPMTPVSAIRHSRANSVAGDSPSESLRQRLRSLSELDQPPPTTPTKRHSLILSPVTPRSTHATPGHGRAGTPGSCTPTSNSHATAPPQSPTPRRTARPTSMHRHSISHQYEDRPTTSRLRQPPQLSMGPVEVPRSRRQSMLEAPSPMLVATPMLGSSPGSLVSASGSSPTTSVESLPLGPAPLRERRPSEQNREPREHFHVPKENKRASWQERRRSGQSTYSVYSTYTTYSDQSHSNSHYHSSRYTQFPQPHPHPQPSYAQAASAEWRRPGVTVSVLDDMEGERFLDFDDI